MTKKQRNGFLDFLKLVFAVIIVIGHGDTRYGSVHPNKLIPLASFGVEFFFIVSGAMLLKSVEKQKQGKTLGEDTLKFMSHKIKGLLPNYYIAWLFLFVILNVGKDLKTVIFAFFKTIPELLFLQMSGMPTETYNGNTWYISAMLLALLVIYPVIRKNRDIFIKYIAPTISVFGVGYITHNFNTILVINEWNGFVYFGVIRGIVEICIGCIAYDLSQKIKYINLTRIGKILLTILETSLYTGVLVMLFSYTFRYHCFVLLFILAIAICITLSDLSYSKHFFRHKLFNWMGEYSYSLYLGHSIAYTNLIWNHIYNRGDCYFETMLSYFVLSLASGLLIMYTSKHFLIVWCKVKPKIKNILVTSN